MSVTKAKAKVGKAKAASRSDALEALWMAACDAAAKERATYETVREDWMSDNGICASCKGRGYHRHRTSADGFFDWSGEHCAACDGTGYTSKVGGRAAVGWKSGVPAVDVDGLFPKHAELVAAEAECVRLDDARFAARSVERNPRGRTVRVFEGRKVPVGTVGRVFWCGSNTWGESVGIVLADGSKQFTSLDNVEVIDWSTPHG